MITAILEANHKRIVISDISREEGSDQLRILGELIYQLETDTNWCDAVAVDQRAKRVSVTLRGRSSGRDVTVEIDDVIDADEHAVTVRRTWLLSDAGQYRLFFDYRLNTASGGVIMPAHVYAPQATHRLRTPIIVSSDRLSIPAVLFVGPEISQAIVRIPTDNTDGGRFESYLSDGLPAIQIRLSGHGTDSQSGGYVVVKRRSGPQQITATFRILVQRNSPALLVTRAHRAAWDPGPSAERSPSVLEFLRVRQAYVDSHLESYRGRPAGVRPAHDDRTGDQPTVLTAVSPYRSLDAAETLLLSADQFQEPDRLETAAAIAEFFCAGLQPDGSFCDAFDPQTRRWGTLRSGRAEVKPGAGRLSSAAQAGTRLVRLYDELRRSGRDMPRVSRTAAEIAEYCIRHQSEDGGYEEPMGTATTVSLLCALQRIRGRNSTRSVSLKRAVVNLLAIAADPDRFLTIAGSRTLSLETLRAALDLLDLKMDRPLKSVVETAGGALLSWVVTRDLWFPPRSVAGRLRVRTAGMTVASIDRQHLDFDGLPIALELFRWSQALADPAPAEVARVMVRASMQLVSGLTGGIGAAGEQPAEVDFVEWSSQRRLGTERGRILGSRIGQASASITAAYDIAHLFPQELPLHEMPNSCSSSS